MRYILLTAAFLSFMLFIVLDGLVDKYEQDIAKHHSERLFIVE
jgi:hypothetical protein